MRNVLKVSELNNSVEERAYQESLRGKYEVWRGGEVESAEEEWENFRDIVMECNNDVCVMKQFETILFPQDMIQDIYVTLEYNT